MQMAAIAQKRQKFKIGAQTAASLKTTRRVWKCRIVMLTISVLDCGQYYAIAGAVNGVFRTMERPYRDPNSCGALQSSNSQSSARLSAHKR
jgi:hypothetical protein